ncbi:hypothetical protein STEG23_009621, partial [Scotinomys teguina]
FLKKTLLEDSANTLDIWTRYCAVRYENPCILKESSGHPNIVSDFQSHVPILFVWCYVEESSREMVIVVI